MTKIYYIMKIMLNTIPNQNIEKIQINGDRYYNVDNTYYKSVTSILNSVKNPNIDQWRNKIGIDAANLISKTACDRGTRIHSLCELYLLNNKNIKYENLSDSAIFETCFINELDKIDNIHCLETTLISHKLKYAGTVDCIAEYEGKLSVIDFKTSLKPKKESYIDSYFLQTAAYAMAYNEMTGTKIDDLVIIIGVDKLDKAQVFKQSLINWENKFIYIVNNLNKHEILLNKLNQKSGTEDGAVGPIENPLLF